MTARGRWVPLATAAACASLATAVAPMAQAATPAPGAAATRAATATPVTPRAVDGPATLAAGPMVPGTTCPAFPADSWWNTDISGLPVHARSDDWMSNMSPGRDLHPDFGPSYGEQPVPYGIPITVVGAGHPKHEVRFDYASESDHRTYPLGKDTLIEGGRGASGDRHAIIVNKASCRLFETFATRKTDRGWRAGSGASWSLFSHRLRPDTWTSADAAGLPILPGLLRLDEVQARDVRHAIRFTTDVTSRWYLWPARHQAGSKDSHTYPPMGARFRLKADFDLSGYRADTRAVLRAMRTYGLVLADNGSPWYFQGTSEKGWPSGLLDELKTIPAREFEAVDTSSLMIDEDSARALQP